MNDAAKGTLVIIGGAEDKDGQAVILRRFLELAGGKKARIAVITTATEQPDRVGQDYDRIFTRLGVQEVIHLDISTRRSAKSPSHCKLLGEITGVFFTGGDQVRITSILGGTPVEETLRERLSHGVVVAGTSAGASAMSDTMIVGGIGEDAPKQDTVRMAPGLSLLSGVAVDQHFAQRGRINRLLSVVAQHPYVLGLGIDEDTAVVITGGRYMEVVGSSTATVIDGRGMTFSNVSESKQDQPLALYDVKVHTLPAGHGYDLQERLPLTPAELQ
ncbi:MAG: cyanophycinase [Bacillota bacterium]